MVRLERVDETEQCRLDAARRAECGEELTGGEGEADIGDGGDSAEAAADAVESQTCHGRAPRGSRSARRPASSMRSSVATTVSMASAAADKLSPPCSRLKTTMPSVSLPDDQRRVGRVSAWSAGRKTT